MSGEERRTVRLDEPGAPADSGLLLELSRRVTGTLDLQEVLDLSFAALHQLVDFGGGAIQLVESGELVAVATDPVATEDALTVRIPVGRGVSGRIAETGGAIYIPDIATDLRVDSRGREKGVSSGVRSYFGAPLILHGAPTGVVQIDSPRVDAFSHEARGLVLAFLPTIAAAVQNALLFRRELEALDEIREVERLKSDFLAVLTHELRTPITSVIGFAETMVARSTALDPDLILEFGRRIAAAGRRLRRMIDDLLDIAQIERGGFAVEPAPTDVTAIVHEAVTEATTPDHPIEVELEEPLPKADADAARLQQILTSLIGNAAKFSPRGAPIVLSARAEDGRVAVSVSDRGPGIPEELRERIFERFFQASPASTRAAGGVGIGLYLVRLLCDRMGAEVSVSSAVGQGSRFTVLLAAAV